MLSLACFLFKQLKVIFLSLPSSCASRFAVRCLPAQIGFCASISYHTNVRFRLAFFPAMNDFSGGHVNVQQLHLSL